MLLGYLLTCWTRLEGCVDIAPCWCVGCHVHVWLANLLARGVARALWPSVLHLSPLQAPSNSVRYKHYLLLGDYEYLLVFLSFFLLFFPDLPGGSLEIISISHPDSQPFIHLLPVVSHSILHKHPGADPGFWNGGWIFSPSIREVREIKYYFNIWGIRKKKKKKERGENSPISPPLDLRLSSVVAQKHQTRADVYHLWSLYVHLLIYADSVNPAHDFVQLGALDDSCQGCVMVCAWMSSALHPTQSTPRRPLHSLQGDGYSNVQAIHFTSSAPYIHTFIW